MAKYLDDTGLKELWARIKSAIGKYLPLSGGTMTGTITTTADTPLKIDFGDEHGVATLTKTSNVVTSGRFSGRKWDTMDMEWTDSDGKTHLKIYAQDRSMTTGASFSITTYSEEGDKTTARYSFGSYSAGNRYSSTSTAVMVGSDLYNYVQRTAYENQITEIKEGKSEGVLAINDSNYTNYLTASNGSTDISLMDVLTLPDGTYRTILVSTTKTLSIACVRGITENGVRIRIAGNWSPQSGGGYVKTSMGGSADGIFSTYIYDYRSGVAGGTMNSRLVEAFEEFVYFNGVWYSKGY